MAPRLIEFFAYRSATLDVWSIFEASPIQFRATLHPDIDLTGCTSLRLDIRSSLSDNSDPLASEFIDDPVGTEFDFVFSSAQTNQNISQAWIVLSAFYPEGAGPEDDELDSLYTAELRLTSHNAGIAAPSPPNPFMVLQEDDADLRYLINSGASQTLVGRYSSGTGVFQAITLGDNLSLNPSGVLSASEGTITIAGSYTPVRSSEINLDSNVTLTSANYFQIGSIVNVGGYFTANPTSPAAATSFEITLPVASNIGVTEDVAGVAFCGEVAGMGASIKGSVANNTAVVFWISSALSSNSFSYNFIYKVI